MKLFTITLLCVCSAACSAVCELDTKWWKHTSIYELIVSSFKDSDGDGIGDLRGITSKLDHFVDLGIETIYLTPCFESPMRDMGYEISDYYKIHHKFGTIEDFEELIKEMKTRGMKLMLDLVINHSGDSNEWFQKSINRIVPYTDYYVWENASGFDSETLEPIPPDSGWGCGSSCWEWNTKRQQFYYHVFMKDQPDLNLRNEIVKTELKNIIKFWMDKGVSGFRLDAPMVYIEPKDWKNWDGEKRLHTENIEFIHEMRLFLDEYNRDHGGVERIFAAEARVSRTQFYDYFGSENYTVTHFPFEYLDQGSRTEANHLYAYLQSRCNEYNLGYLPVWVTEGHDGPRIRSRMIPEFADILIMMTMTLPGSVCLYYGQEIAMRDGYITLGQERDILGGGSRDPGRLLMQWDDSLNAGFSSNITTYLPANAEYPERNVKKQKNQEISHYNLVKTLLALRKMETLRHGDFKLALQPPQTLIFWRTLEEYETYIFVANTDRTVAYVNLKYLFWDSPDTLTVAAASVNSEHKKGDKIRNDLVHQIPIRPRSSILLTLNASGF